LGEKDRLCNIGGNYLRLGKYALSLDYNLKGLKIAEESGNKYVMLFALGNIGAAYFAEENYPLALQYYFKALQIAREIGDMDEVADSYTELGGVYTRLKKYDQAKVLLDSALYISKKLGDKKYTKDVYERLNTLDSAMGNNRASYADYKEYILYRDSLVNQESVKKITQMELNRQFQKVEDSIKAEQQIIMNTERSDTNRKRLIAYGVIIVLILSGGLLIRTQVRKRKADKKVFEKETTQLVAEKNEKETELANARALLEEHIKAIIEKNALLEQSGNTIEELKKEVSDKKLEYIDDLNNTTILTEDDWSKFKALFEEVHKGFLTRLKEKIPNLTQAEIRLICLTKLQLGTTQMADILGVSANTIKSSRYQLRKKLGLSGKDGLMDVAESI